MKLVIKICVYSVVVFFFIQQLFKQQVYSQNSKRVTIVIASFQIAGITERDKNNLIDSLIYSLTSKNIIITENEKNAKIKISGTINYDDTIQKGSISIKIENLATKEKAKWIYQEYNHKFDKLLKSSSWKSLVSKILDSLPLQLSYNELILSGIEHLKEQKYSQAESDFKAAKKLNNNNSDAYNYLGNTYYLQGKYNLAKTELEHVLQKIDSKNKEALLLLAKIYLAKSDIDLSIKYFDSYLKLNENDHAIQVLVDSIKKWQALPKIVYKESHPETTVVNQFYTGIDSKFLLDSLKSKLHEDSIKYNKLTAAKNSTIDSLKAIVTVGSDSLEYPNESTIYIILTKYYYVIISIFVCLFLLIVFCVFVKVKYFWESNKLEKKLKLLSNKVKELQIESYRNALSKDVASDDIKEFYQSLLKWIDEIAKVKDEMTKLKIIPISKRVEDDVDYQAFWDNLHGAAKDKGFDLIISDELKNQYKKLTLKINEENIQKYFTILFNLREERYSLKKNKELKLVKIVNVQFKYKQLWIFIKWKSENGDEIEKPNKHWYWKNLIKLASQDSMKIVYDKNEDLIVAKLPVSEK